MKHVFNTACVICLNLVQQNLRSSLIHCDHLDLLRAVRAFAKG